MKPAEKYEYRLPEGYEFKPNMRMKFDGLIDEVNKKGEIDEVTAQRFLDLHVEMMEEYAANLEDAVDNAIDNSMH